MVQPVWHQLPVPEEPCQAITVFHYQEQSSGVVGDASVTNISWHNRRSCERELPSLERMFTDGLLVLLVQRMAGQRLGQLEPPGQLCWIIYSNIVNSIIFHGAMMR